jgi:hypothetical protein
MKRVIRTTDPHAIAGSMDEFISVLAEVFEIPKRKLEKMVHQFEEEPEIISKGETLHGVQSRISSTHTA